MKTKTKKHYIWVVIAFIYACCFYSMVLEEGGIQSSKSVLLFFVITAAFIYLYIKVYSIIAKKFKDNE